MCWIQNQPFYSATTIKNKPVHTYGLSRFIYFQAKVHQKKKKNLDHIKTNHSHHIWIVNSKNVITLSKSVFCTGKLDMDFIK